jgi:O-antigen/teichoic acid export membrane protein
MIHATELQDRSVSAQKLRARYRLGTFWNVISATTTQGSVFLANLIVARLLGQTAFGEFSIVYVTMVAASGIAQVATGVTATKYVAEFRDADKHRAGRVLGLCSLISLFGGALMALVLVVSAPWLARQVLNAPHLASELAIGAGYLWFTAISGYQQGALAGLESYRRLAQVSLVHGAAHVGAMAFATYHWGVLGTALALTVSAAIRWLVFNAALRIEVRRSGIAIRYRDALEERPIVVRFAIPAAIAGLSSMPGLWLATAFVGQQPGGYAQLGLYSAANSLKNIVLFLPALMNNVGTALLNHQRAGDDKYHYRGVFWTNFAATAAVLVVAAAVLAGSGKWLLGLFGRDFTQAYPILLVLLFAAIFEGLSVAVYQVVQSQERMWLSLLAVSLPRDAALVLMAYLFVPEHGGSGLAAASLLSWLLALTVIVSVVGRTGVSGFHTDGRKRGNVKPNNANEEPERE